MATRAQIAANRANARKSTGPRTVAGKSRSRANSLKHGMTGAGIVLPEEDIERWEERAELWAEEMGATGDMDRFLAGRAAMASVRLDRCVREETASLADIRARMLSRWQNQRVSRASVDFHARELATDPAAALRGLTATVLGCEWLLDRWDGLVLALAERGYWDESRMREVLALIGVVENPTQSSPPVASRLFAANLAMAAIEGGPGGLEDWERFFEIANAEGERDDRFKSASSRLMEPEEAFPILSGLCDSERARLQIVRDALWEAVDGPSRRAVLLANSVDTDPKGMLRRRYETAATSELHRSINQVHANRRAARAAMEADELATLGEQVPTPPGHAHEGVSMAPEVVELAGEIGPIAGLPDEPNRPELATEIITIEGVSTVNAPAQLPTDGQVGAAADATESALRNEPNGPASGASEAFPIAAEKEGFGADSATLAVPSGL